MNVITHTFVELKCLTETKIQILCDHVDHTRFHIVEMECQMVQLLSAHIVRPTLFVNLVPALHCVKETDYLCNCKSEISNVCIAVEDHCFQAMKIVYHYANSCFHWLISGHLSVNPLREGISILSGKYKRFTSCGYELV